MFTEKFSVCPKKYICIVFEYFSESSFDYSILGLALFKCTNNTMDILNVAQGTWRERY
jgi:hypothetical protein